MKVWHLQIDHGTGTDVSLHVTEDEAIAARLAYVDKWWDVELHLTRKPEDPDWRVASYFAAMRGDEQAQIREIELPDEVLILTEAERRLIVDALLLWQHARLPQLPGYLIPLGRETTDGLLTRLDAKNVPPPFSGETRP
jgi:hypothetical protein